MPLPIKDLAIPFVWESKRCYEERTEIRLTGVEWVALCQRAADVMHDKYLAERRVLEGLPVR